ncbi:MAG: glycosyltransferase family A protein [Rikenellaceae bacterium]
MLFSILIPVYNVEQYLEDCLNSVLNQSFQGFEVIIVNDGSTDNSLTICAQYAKENRSKISLWNRDNHGLLLTRRFSMSKAKGDYFVFLDSDDMLREDALEQLSKTIESTKADLVLYNFSRNTDYSTSGLTLPFATGIPLNKEDVYHEMPTGHLNNLWKKCVKNTCIDIGVDYSYVKDISRGEDLIQSLPMIDQAKTIVCLNENLYFYRCNPTSITQTYVCGIFENFKRVANISQKYYEKWGVDEAYLYQWRFKKCMFIAIGGKCQLKYT